jgi:hypothetical protein
MQSVCPYPLAPYWPYSINTADDWRRDTSLCKVYKIGPFDSTSQMFTVDSDGEWNSPLLLPKNYKNGLRLMNAKISFLQRCAEIFSIPPPSHISSRRHGMLRLARDSVIRNLHFHTTIRRIFCSQLGAVVPQQAHCSKEMDAWLYCEFLCGRHEPSYVEEHIGGSHWKLCESGECRFSIVISVFSLIENQLLGQITGILGMAFRLNWNIGGHHQLEKKIA